MIAFHFSPSRSRDVAKSLLGDYSGTIIRDSYAAYEKLDCEVACCWAHARRRFLQAVENGYGKAEPLLKIIQELYQIERVAKERAEKKGTETALFQERKNARRQSQKLVQEFFAQCRVLKESERPSSPVAQAISYALNIEAELKKFLKDSRLNIDNNPAERLNRGIAIIRKNCLFAGSVSKGLPLDCRAMRLNLKSQLVELPRPQPQDGVCSRTNRTFYLCCRVYRPSRNLAGDRQDSPVVFDALAIQAAGF